MTKVEAELNYQVCKVCIREEIHFSIPGTAVVAVPKNRCIVVAVETDTIKRFFSSVLVQITW
jgi:hypothetical protein